jgi:hypothetical protein
MQAPTSTPQHGGNSQLSPSTRYARLLIGRSGLPAVLMLLILVLCGVPGCFGQGITGSITGTVTDPTGAAIPGATVTITEVATNSVHTIQTSDAGTYTVPQLPPGQYSVKVDKGGFGSYQQNNITLSIDQVEKIDAQLTVGSAAQTVDVTATSPVIQAEDSSIGEVIDSQAIQNTPLNGRLGLMGLIALAPGVQGAGAQDQLATRGVTAAIGTGGRNAYGGLGSTLDGVTNQEVTLQRGEGEVPSLDAISQFKVLTNAAPAEFNQPAQIIVVSASGANQVHGEGLEYNRSKGLGAKSFFAGGTARPPYQRNEYGGNLSGPIVLPKLYNGRDKSFFFFAFEGFHLTQSYSDSTQQPTLQERQGDFSELLAGGDCATTPGGTQIINPATGLPFPGNIIPKTSWDNVDQQLLTILYPKPTKSGCGTNTQEEVQETSEATRFSLRLDHKINENNQLRFTYLRAFYGPSPTNGTDSLQGGNAQDGEHNTNFILGWTHTFSPTLLLDVAGSYFHLPIYRTPQNYKTDFSSIIPGLGPELIEGAPQITITNITTVGESGSKDLEQDAQVNTSLTKVFAKHTVKAGFSYLYNDHWNDSAYGSARGAYSFNGHYTGNALADFILGDPISTTGDDPNNYITRNESSQYGLYIQDDWKPLNHLTINAGLRYDLQWFENNPYGNNSLYVPSLQEVVVFGHQYPAAAIPSFLTSIPIALSSSVGLPSSVFSYLGQDKNNFAPRLGFAYEPITNTVVRGAFGIYYNMIPASYIGSTPFGTLPFAATQTYTNSSGTTPAFTMENPFAGTGAFSAHPSVSAQAHTVNPYTEEYNLTVEHQFAKGLDIRIGYVGQHNLKQNNSGGPGTTTPNINLANPPVVGVSTQTTNLVQPFSSITVTMDPLFHSTENALQVGVHKQYQNGFTIGAEYSWTRVLGTENIENPSGATPNDSYGPISGVTPQVLTANYSYLLPFGHGKLLFGSANNFADKIISGWQISGITNIQTGQPFSVTYTAPGKPTGLVSGRANLVPGVPVYPSSKTRAEWFNPAAFAAPGCYNSDTSGSCTSTTVYNSSSPTTYATYGNSGYDTLRGPAFQDWDMSLQKNVRFNEKYNVQLRADSFNVFNHPNFAPPNSAISNPSNVGQITSVSSTPNYEPRTVEFAAKLSF